MLRKILLGGGFRFLMCVWHDVRGAGLGRELGTDLAAADERKSPAQRAKREVSRA